MCEDKIVSKEKLNFTFEGGLEVDALTVSKTIEDLVKIMSITANAEYPESSFHLSISAVKPGSLDIYFNAVTESVQTLLNAENINRAKSILEVLVALFNIKSFLKKKKPESVKNIGDKVEVKNCQGNILVAPKAANIYFLDCNVDGFISSIFSSVKGSQTVTGISVTAGCGERTSIQREEFDDLSEEICGIVESPKQIMYERKDVLFIKKPDLLGDSIWTFQSDKQIIADIADNDFMNRIHSGEIKVCAGMSIVANILVRYELSKNGLPNEKTSKYTVLKVEKINFPEDDQISIF
jgi:hypothetical protein